MAPHETIDIVGLSAEEFSMRVSAAAASYVGEPFVEHDSLAGCMLGVAHDRCNDTGLGVGGFDCSGLVVRAVSDVLEIDPQSWPDGLRHSIQMHRALLGNGLREPQLKPGALLFKFARGIPGHVMVAVSNDSIVHATSDGGEVSSYKTNNPESFIQSNPMFPVVRLAEIVLQRRGQDNI